MRDASQEVIKPVVEAWDPIRYGDFYVNLTGNQLCKPDEFV